MAIWSKIILVCWLAFWAYWIASAAGSKKNNYSNIGQRIRREAFFRLIIIVLIVLVAFIRPSFFSTIDHPLGYNVYRLGAGLVLFFLGLAFAIWARRSLGENWGMPMSLKQNPELVTSGAYRFVRHPIYSGILLAILGTGIALNPAWLLISVVAGIYFVYSATVEEQIMVKAFPQAYPGYKQKTKMLLPFIL